MRSTPENLETLKKFKIVNRMAIQRRTISTSPRRGDLSPKKTTDQRMLRIN
jgi:hypothetical protein